MDNKEDTLSMIEDIPVCDNSPSERLHTLELSNMIKFVLKDSRFIVKDTILSGGGCVITLGDTFSKINDYEIVIKAKIREVVK